MVIKASDFALANKQTKLKGGVPVRFGLVCHLMKENLSRFLFFITIKAYLCPA